MFVLLAAIAASMTVIAYLQTGYALAKLSWRTWRSGGGALAFLLFPYSHMRCRTGQMSNGSRDDETLPYAASGDDCFEGYAIWMAVAWPLKIAWNAVAIVVMSPIIAWPAAMWLLRICVFGPERALRKLTARRPETGAAGGELPVAVPSGRGGEARP